MEVQVRDNNIEQALRALKKKMQREGVYREMKMRRHFEKPSERRVREQSEAMRRYRKLMRKRMVEEQIAGRGIHDLLLWQHEDMLCYDLELF